MANNKFEVGKTYYFGYKKNGGCGIYKGTDSITHIFEPIEDGGYVISEDGNIHFFIGGNIEKVATEKI